MKNKDRKPELLYLVRDTETGDLFSCEGRLELGRGRIDAEWVLDRMKHNIAPDRFELVEFEERSNTDRMADRGRTSGGVWEMKLYAVVDKKSGVIATETVDLESITLYGLKETAVRRRRESDMMETSDIVAVELKEVAGPCEWCGVLKSAGIVLYPSGKHLPPAEMMFCPNCGRRLGDE